MMSRFLELVFGCSFFLAVMPVEAAQQYGKVITGEEFMEVFAGSLSEMNCPDFKNYIPDSVGNAVIGTIFKEGQANQRWLHALLVNVRRFSGGAVSLKMPPTEKQGVVEIVTTSGDRKRSVTVFSSGRIICEETPEEIAERLKPPAVPQAPKELKPAGSFGTR